jgi:DNA-binding XRE family transcriptional regulator
LVQKEAKNEENLVKKTCRELGITQKELAEKIGVSPHTITRWNKDGLDKTTEVLLKGLVYEKKFIDLKKFIKDV